MLSKKQTIAMTSAVTAGLFLTSQVPALANGNFEIKENARGSENTILYNSSKDTNVSQENNAQITNNVQVNANTGGLQSSDNHGDTKLTSGDVNTSIGISNEANSNRAVITGCGCDDHISASIRDNGRNTDNVIVVTKSDETNVEQANNAHFTNNVGVNANTGNSESSDNNSGNSTPSYGGNGGNNSTWGNDNHKSNNSSGNTMDKFWKNYWMNDDWKSKDWWKKYFEWENNNHSGNNGTNSGNTEITSGDVNTNIMIHNTANRNDLTM